MPRRKVKNEPLSDSDSSDSEDERKKETLRRRAKREKRKKKRIRAEEEEALDKINDVKFLGIISLHPAFRLSGCSMVFVCAYIATWIFIWFFRPALGFSILFLFISFVPMAIWWFRNREVAQLDDVVLHFATGFFPAFIAVYFFQYVITMLLLGLHLGVTSIGLASWPTEAYGPFQFFLLAVDCIVGMALPEQIMKYKAAESIIDERPASKANLIYGVAFALGFGTAQSILLTLICHGAAHLFNVWSVIQTTAIAALFGTPMHCLDTYLTGCEVMMKKKFGAKTGYGRIIFPVILRGILVLQAVVFIYKGPYHGWLCLVPALCIFILMFIYTKRVEKGSPWSIGNK